MSVLSGEVHGLEKAVSLDPRNREFLNELASNYLSLRRYRDYEHTYDRLIELEPDKPALTLQRARSTLWGNAVDGLPLLYNLAAIYGMVNESDLAFQVLAVSAKIPGGVSYGELKLGPCWDPLRKDPRFEKLLAELAPRD